MVGEEAIGGLPDEEMVLVDEFVPVGGGHWGPFIARRGSGGIVVGGWGFITGFLFAKSGDVFERVRF